MKKTSLFNSLKFIGPGLAVAATGVGAGDMIAASVAGAKYGVVVLWAVILGAVLKYALNEGIARWQFATGSTILEGWISRLPSFFSIYFIIYLGLWSFIVAGALISACGLAANAVFPEFSIQVWGVIHSLFCVLLVFVGRYNLFEKLMKFFIAVMFCTLIFCAAVILPEIEFSWSYLIPSVPTGSGKFLLGVLGGVGGSVTLLSYSYWIKESGWTSKDDFKKSKIDLSVAYIFTGLFGIAVLIIASGVTPNLLEGGKIILEIAARLENVLGSAGKWAFLIGFWGAVFTSLLGVWQGVPYLFSDFVTTYNKNKDNSYKPTKEKSNFYYNIYLFYLAVPPLLLLLFNKPGWIVIIYTIVGSMFMPFLAVTLIMMNNKKAWVGNFKNNLLINFILIVSLVVFLYVSINEIIDLFG